MEEGKWYGIWVENEGDFQLAQGILMSSFGIKRALTYSLDHYEDDGGVWVLCRKGRHNLAYCDHKVWHDTLHGPLVEVPLSMSLENE